MFAEKYRNKSAFIVLLVTTTLLSLSLSAVIVLFNAALSEFKSVSQEAEQTKARYIAQSGLEATVMLLTKVPIKLLYEFGIMESPPPIPLGQGMVQFSISEETGKININRLIHFFDDDADLRNREMLDRLSESLGIPSNIWDGAVDWIDENDNTMPRGYEKIQYQALSPPRRIKNARMQSLEELLLIPGFTRSLLYEDLRTESQKKETSDAFNTEEEKLVVTDGDYILANNITVTLPERLDYGDKININMARYHVILSLTESMTPVIVRKLLTERLKAGGRFKSLDDIKKILDQYNSISGVGIYQEIQPVITLDDILYKIVAEGSTGSQKAHVVGVFDRQAGKLVNYLE